MLTLRRILLPVDFSERSEAAAGCAAALASRFGSEVVLLHVVPPPQYEYGAMEAGGALIAELYRNRSEQAARDLEVFEGHHLGGAEKRGVVLEGEPAARIIEYAHANSIGIIIMPTHGYGPFRRFILGSNTAKVLHDADCPVWTGVHMPEAATRECLAISRVLCAVDLGPQSSKALCWAAGLAGEFGAGLTLFHSIAEPPGHADTAQTEWLNSIRQSAEAEIGRLRETADAQAEIEIAAGDPAKTICAAAERLHADVLVIGRGSAAGVYGRLRTNSYAIIRQSPCPVVSV
jgi:nucleotide-binding universal stress UspA family protein